MNETDKKKKNELLRSFQSYLKSQGNLWKQQDKSFDIRREYDGEEFVLLSSRNEKNPRVMEIIIFVDTQEEGETIMKWSTTYNMSLLRIVDQEKVAVKHRIRSPGDTWWMEDQ